MSRGRGGVHRGVGRRTRRMAWVKGGARHYSQRLVERLPSFAARRANHLVLQRCGDGPGGGRGRGRGRGCNHIGQICWGGHAGESKGSGGRIRKRLRVDVDYGCPGGCAGPCGPGGCSCR